MDELIISIEMVACLRSSFLLKRRKFLQNAPIICETVKVDTDSPQELLFENCIAFRSLFVKRIFKNQFQHPNNPIFGRMNQKY